MTRRVVAIEGKETQDGHIILPGAISMKKDSIPVMGTHYTEQIGKAGWFVRDTKTGEISLDIITKYELIDNVNVHISLYNLVCKDVSDDETIVIESADLVGVFVSLGDSAWPELNRKE